MGFKTLIPANSYKMDVNEMFISKNQADCIFNSFHSKKTRYHQRVIRMKSNEPFLGTGVRALDRWNPDRKLFFELLVRDKAVGES